MTVVGVAQVGMGGISKVQYAVRPQDQSLPADDPFMTQVDWRDGRILPPPSD